jgi:hypothetical protein
VVNNNNTGNSIKGRVCPAIYQKELTKSINIVIISPNFNIVEYISTMICELKHIFPLFKVNDNNDIIMKVKKRPYKLIQTIIGVIFFFFSIIVACGWKFAIPTIIRPKIIKNKREISGNI